MSEDEREYVEEEAPPEAYPYYSPFMPMGGGDKARLAEILASPEKFETPLETKHTLFANFTHDLYDAVNTLAGLIYRLKSWNRGEHENVDQKYIELLEYRWHMLVKSSLGVEAKGWAGLTEMRSTVRHVMPERPPEEVEK